jgi:hypothetical protein
VLRPIVLPYVVSGTVFVFILSLNEYIIAYLVAGFEVETLPIKVFNNLRMGFQPTMCVGAVLFMAVGTLAVSLVAASGELGQLRSRALDTSVTTQLRLLIQRCVGRQPPSSLNCLACSEPHTRRWGHGVGSSESPGPAPVGAGADISVRGGGC